MNTFTKAVFLMLAMSAKAADIESNNPQPSLGVQSNIPPPAPVMGRNSNPRPSPNRRPSNPRPGSSICTWSPDYDCYRSGWPECCDDDTCPRDGKQPACEINRSPTRRPSPNRRPSRPTRRPSRRPTVRPTRRPTKRPTNRRPSTRRPTRRPTKRPTNRRPTDDCVDDDRPRPVRDGQRFRFNLVDEDSQCTDDRDNLYEYGMFEDVENFSECAELCVNNVPEGLAMDDGFRGYDYYCDSKRCSCLYDSGTLDNRNSGRFDRTNRNESGRGSITGTTRRAACYCGKLVGAELLEGVVAEA